MSEKIFTVDDERHNDINLEAVIVADINDALSGDLPYRDALISSKTIGLHSFMRESSLDSGVIDCFSSVMKKKKKSSTICEVFHV